MKQIITNEQKCEIEKLAVDHRDAMLAFGADMYRQGLIKGAILVVVGTLVGVTISHLRKEKKKSSEQ